MPLNEIVGIIAMGFAVTGVIANNRKLRFCFILFLISNTLSGGIHAHIGIWSLLLRDTIFFVLAIEGWFKWGRKDEGKDGKDNNKI